MAREYEFAGFRLLPKQRALIEQAAEIVGSSFSAIVRDGGVREARLIIARARRQAKAPALEAATLAQDGAGDG
jgi:uncharacterized protein (DUF1778 family)